MLRCAVLHCAVLLELGHVRCTSTLLALTLTSLLQYRGDGPASEAEVAVLQDFVNEIGSTHQYLGAIGKYSHAMQLPFLAMNVALPCRRLALVYPAHPSAIWISSLPCSAERRAGAASW